MKESSLLFTDIWKYVFLFSLLLGAFYLNVELRIKNNVSSFYKISTVCFAVFSLTLCYLWSNSNFSVFNAQIEIGETLTRTTLEYFLSGASGSIFYFFVIAWNLYNSKDRKLSKIIFCIFAVLAIFDIYRNYLYYL